jgi:hypothetical protein
VSEEAERLNEWLVAWLPEDRVAEGSRRLNAILARLDAVEADRERLYEAVNLLWGWMPGEQVAEIHRDAPELAGLAMWAHHHVDHAPFEQRAMRALASTPGEEPT